VLGSEFTGWGVKGTAEFASGFKFGFMDMYVGCEPVCWNVEEAGMSQRRDQTQDGGIRGRGREAVGHSGKEVAIFFGEGLIFTAGGFCSGEGKHHALPPMRAGRPQGRSLLPHALPELPNLLVLRLRPFSPGLRQISTGTKHLQSQC